VFIDTQLRDYARASTVQIAIQIGSSLSVIVGWELLCGLYRALLRLVQTFGRLPPTAQAISSLAAKGNRSPHLLRALNAELSQVAATFLNVAPQA
jgi:hypothetical protein